MSFLSVLKAIGHGFGIGIKVADQLEQNPAVQGIESVFLTPAVVKLIAGLIHSVAGAQVISEGSLATAGLSGEQKMSIAFAAANNVYTEYAKSVGLPDEPAEVKAVLQLAFNLLDGIKSGIPLGPATGTPAPVLPGTPTT